MSSGSTYRIVISSVKLLAVRTVVVTCQGDAMVPLPLTGVCDAWVQVVAPLALVPVTALPIARFTPSPKVR